MPAFRRILDRLRRRLLIHRRLLAALCLGAAVLLTVSALRPPAPKSVALWTAARALPSGSVLTEADLRRTAFAPGSAPPSGLRDRRTALGRTLAIPLGAGEPLTPAKLLGDGLLTGHPGQAAVPVRIPDGEVVGLLRVGDQVDVIASDPRGARPPERIVTDAAVLAVPEPGRGATGPGTPGRLVVLAAPSDTVTRVAEAAASLYLTVIWNR